MNRFFIFAAVFFILLSFSCRNNREPENTDDIDPEAIFLDYQVRGEEGNDLVTVLLQFKAGDSYGAPLALNAPSQVELDGKLVPAGHSKMTGTFYEIQRPVNGFSGTHTLVFTDAKNRKYKEEFSFQSMSLATAIPDTLRRNELVFDFEGLEPVDKMRVVIADTSYPGQEVDRSDTVKNGHLIIPEEDILSLANGPIQALFIREQEIDVKNHLKKAGGRIAFSYTLKREFFLTGKAGK